MKYFRFLLKTFVLIISFLIGFISNVETVSLYKNGTHDGDAGMFIMLSLPFVFLLGIGLFTKQKIRIISLISAVLYVLTILLYGHRITIMRENPDEIGNLYTFGKAKFILITYILL